MASGVLTPRQKMINMMYLVLTALLALNVSAEILKAFHLVEVSLDKSTTNIDSKNAMVMKAIEKYHAEFPNDVNGNSVYEKSKKARQIAGEAVKYIEEIKQVVIAGADGRKEDTNSDGKIEDEEVAKADDIENHANLMINNKKGEELKKKINETRDQLLALLPKDKVGGVNSDLITLDFKEEGENKKWESVMFEHTPAAAVVTLLAKFQGDVRNTEAQVLDILRASISESDFTFDKLEPKVIPNNGTYITLGSEYSADIFVAASSSKQEASISVNGANVPVEEGIGKYKVIATSEGEKEYSGVITARKPNGEVTNYPFKATYTALKPMAVISATKMNVVYIGLQNPISVSVPGYSAKEVKVSVSPSTAGSIKQDKQAGTYLLTVNKTAREIAVSASVDKNGKTTKMGEQKYRIRVIPDPTPALGTIEQSGGVAAAQLRSQTVIRAPLKNFAFEGVNYIPFEFQFLLIPKKGGAAIFETARGQQLTANMKNALARAQKGDKIIITQIKVKGPDGAKQLPTPLVFDVQ